jgi:O-antigen biosynthesis protein
VIANIARPDGQAASSKNIDSRLEKLKVRHGSENTRDRIVDLVGLEKRVLELGCATGSYAHELLLKGCQTVTVTLGPAMASFISHNCERVIVGDIDRVDLAVELGEDRFDVVVAEDLLGRSKDPESILKVAKSVLKPGGSLIVSVPNVAHGSVRIALFCGQFPDDDRGVLNRVYRRFFTRDSLVRLLDEAGFAVGHLESRESPIQGDDVSFDTSSLPTGLLESLHQDPEARIDQFLIVAHPMPIPGLAWFQKRLRETAEQAEMAAREAADLRRIVDAMDTQIASLHRRAEDLAQREKETRAELLTAHDELVRQSEDFRALTRDFIGQRNDLQARLDRIRYSLPGRFYRMVRRVMSSRKP